MDLPTFVKQEINQIYTQLMPEKLSLSALLSQQAAYNNRAIQLQGTVISVASVDELDEQTVSTWWLNLPTTVHSNASATYFYLQDAFGEKILVKYPADLDVSAGDSVVITGMFNAHGVTVKTKSFLHTKQEEITNALGEPFVGAVTVENDTKQKIEYIRQLDN